MPLAAALIYSVAALAIKRALQQGAGPWKVTFFNNLILGLNFQWLLLFHDRPFDWAPLAHAFLPGLLFFLGQIFTFVALDKGDASIATPVLGTKIVLVAAFTVLVIGESVPLLWWIAAIMSTSAIILLQHGNPVGRKKVLLTVFLSFLSAACYAMAEVFVQRYAPVYGPFLFLPLMFASVAALSFLILPFKGPALLSFPRDGKAWFWIGCSLMAFQAIVVVSSIGIGGKATAVNIVYSSRGMVTVVLVWLVGHWFHNTESTAGVGVMGKRLAAAGLITAAIILILIK